MYDTTGHYVQCAYELILLVHSLLRSGTSTGVQYSKYVTNRTIPSPELRGDLAVYGFWTSGQTAIFDVRITDTDQPSNRNSAPSKVLLHHEKEKKDKYGALCIARRRTFTPLVFSIDGLLEKEATAASKRLATSLASKWKRSYSEVCGYIRAPDTRLP